MLVYVSGQHGKFSGIVSSVQINHIVFIHGSLVFSWHVQTDVHTNPDFRHLHRRVWHCFRHPQNTIFKQLTGIAHNDIRIGSKPASPSLHPISVGAGSSGRGQKEFIHTIA